MKTQTFAALGRYCKLSTSNSASATHSGPSPPPDDPADPADPAAAGRVQAAELEQHRQEAACVVAACGH